MLWLSPRPIWWTLLAPDPCWPLVAPDPCWLRPCLPPLPTWCALSYNHLMSHTWVPHCSLHPRVWLAAPRTAFLSCSTGSADRYKHLSQCGVHSMASSKLCYILSPTLETKSTGWLSDTCIWDWDYWGFKTRKSFAQFSATMDSKIWHNYHGGHCHICHIFLTMVSHTTQIKKKTIILNKFNLRLLDCH